MRNVKRLVLLTVFITALFAAVCAQSATVGAQPQVITRGGTYTLDIVNDDARAAVTISTGEAVILDGCGIASRGTAIIINPGANVTIKNCYIECKNPLVEKMNIPLAIEATDAENLTVQNNFFSGGGICVFGFSGDGSINQTINISFNKFRNIDGRQSLGESGVLDTIAEFRQAVWLNKVNGIKNCEIAWNEIINEPYKSSVDYVIKIYKSSGTQDSSLKIHDNFIRGAYPANPLDKGAGGGIICSGGTLYGESGTEYVEIFNNIVTGFTDFGIAITAGNNNSIYNNIVVNSGQMSDGGLIYAQNAGICIHKAVASDQSFGGNNSAYGNICGSLKNAEVINNYYLPDAGIDKNNNSIAEDPEDITPELEWEQYDLWRRLNDNGFTSGINNKTSLEFLSGDTLLLSNNTNSEVSGKLYLRDFSGVGFWDIDIEPHSSRVVKIPEKTGNLKVFYWDSLLRPICNAAEMEIE